MFYLQLHILAFMALICLSAAANFDCDHIVHKGVLVVECELTLNPGNTFYIYSDQGWACTHDGVYCAQITSATDSEWQWSVNNNGMMCSGSCNPSDEGGPSGSYGCQVSSC